MAEGINARIDTSAANKIDEGRVAAGESEPKDTSVDMNTEIPIDGNQKVTIDELKNGYLRQSDYTKKTMDLSNEKKRMESELSESEQLRNFSNAMMQYFNAFPKEYQKVYDYSQNPGQFANQSPNPQASDNGKQPDNKLGNNGNQPKDNQPPPRNLEYDKRFQSLEKQQEDLLKAQTQAKVDQAVDQIQKQYQLSNEAMQKITTHAVDNFNPQKNEHENLMTSFKVLQFDDQFKKGKEVGAEETSKDMMGKLNAQFLGGSGASSSNKKSGSDLIKDSLRAINKTKSIL